jgi:hypothetical protein
LKKFVTEALQSWVFLREESVGKHAAVSHKKYECAKCGKTKEESVGGGID